MNEITRCGAVLNDPSIILMKPSTHFETASKFITHSQASSPQVVVSMIEIDDFEKSPICLIKTTKNCYSVLKIQFFSLRTA